MAMRHLALNCYVMKAEISMARSLHACGAPQGPTLMCAGPGSRFICAASFWRILPLCFLLLSFQAACAFIISLDVPAGWLSSYYDFHHSASLSWPRAGTYTAHNLMDLDHDSHVEAPTNSYSQCGFNMLGCCVSAVHADHSAWHARCGCSSRMARTATT